MDEEIEQEREQSHQTQVVLAAVVLEHTGQLPQIVFDQGGHHDIEGVLQEAHDELVEAICELFIHDYRAVQVARGQSAALSEPLSLLALEIQHLIRLVTVNLRQENCTNRAEPFSN